jgi:hypothetical protein
MNLLDNLERLEELIEEKMISSEDAAEELVRKIERTKIFGRFERTNLGRITTKEGPKEDDKWGYICSKPCYREGESCSYKSKEKIHEEYRCSLYPKIIQILPVIKYNLISAFKRGNGHKRLKL